MDETNNEIVENEEVIEETEVVEIEMTDSEGNETEAVVIEEVEVEEDAEPRSEFADVRDRLQEIAATVEDPELSLDDALDLYEEAVALGLQASDLLEVGIVAEEEDVEQVALEDATSEDGEAAVETTPEAVVVEETSESVD